MITAYFAQVTSTDTTWLPAFARNDFGDDQPVSWSMVQAEGDQYATLTVELGSASAGGWLAIGAKQWLWFAIDDGTTAGPYPMFYGRIVASPSQGEGGSVALTFRARPSDYDAQRAAYAETLKVAPYWDPIWVVTEDREEVDAVLYARPEVWHVDPVTHVVTTSDIITGEAGTVVLTMDQMLWDDYSLRVSRTPLRRVDVEATVQWVQAADGEIDISSKLPLIITFSEAGEDGAPRGGIREDWPTVGEHLGGVWYLSNTSIADVSTSTVDDLALVHTQNGGVSWFSRWKLKATMFARYAVERQRSETLTFSMGIDTQDIVADPDDGDIERIELSTTAVAEPVDIATTAYPNGALPIGDVAYARYFQRTRGIQSMHWLLARARAAHLWHARAIEIDVGAPLLDSLQWTLRHDMTVPDPRLPDGTATGKIMQIERSWDGVAFRALATVGVCPGNGGTVAEIAGDNEYVETGYIEDGYHQLVGQTTAPFGTDITWEDYSDAPIDDDGFDFVTGLTADEAVLTAEQVNTIQEQLEVLQASEVGTTETEIGTAYKSGHSSFPSAVDALANNFSTLCIRLVGISEDPFVSTIPVTVSDLKVRSGIDLGTP